MNLLKYFFEFQYRFGKPRWDTNVTPPEVTTTIESGNVRLGRALDLGCGTGTNAIYLARAGFQVVGVDFSAKAIAVARDKARCENSALDFHTGDVTRFAALGVRDPFDFILDIGCFHSVEPARRTAYVDGLARLSRPGTLFMLYAFGPRDLLWRKVGVTPEQVKQTFERNFSLERIEEGMNRGEFSSAWYWWRRQ